MARPPPNKNINYIGRKTFMVTTVTINRANAFANNSFAAIAVAQLLRQAKKHRFELPAYTFMDDHAHVVATGLCATSNLEKFVAGWKQATGFDWSNFSGGPLWQEGYWDRRLRADGSIVDFIEYVIMNPVRAGMVDHPAKHPLTGSTVYTIDEMVAMVERAAAQKIATPIEPSGDVSEGRGGTKVPPSRR